MKKHLLLLMFTLLGSLTSYAGLPKGVRLVQNPSKCGKLYLDSLYLYGAKDSTEVQLHGFSLLPAASADFSLADYDTAQFNKMKKWKTNAVRISTLADYESGQKGYVQNPLHSDSVVKILLDRAMESDFYAVINWDLFTADENSNAEFPETYAKESFEFFSKIANYVVDKGYNGRVLYEVSNVGGVNFEKAIKPYCETLLDTILKYDAEAILIVPSEGWSQKVLEASQIQLDPRYKGHAMYSFAFAACSHDYLLGDLHAATEYAPVIVSDWSASNFWPAEGFCESASSNLLSLVNRKNEGNQVLSWFFSYWGKTATEQRTLGKAMFEDYEAGTVSDAGEFLARYIDRFYYNEGEEKDFIDPFEYNRIPSSEGSGFDLMNYAKDGEGIAYHDNNSSAYIKDSLGNIVGYAKDGAESDCLSKGKVYSEGLGDNPYFKYDENGEVASWDSTQNLCWNYTWETQQCNRMGYRTLNAGVAHNMDITFYKEYEIFENQLEVYGRAFEGVDLIKCPAVLKDKDAEEGYDMQLPTYSLGELVSIESDEWIIYPVKVEKAGYYSIKCLASSRTKVGAKINFSVNGADGGNIIRNFRDKENLEALNSLAISSPKLEWTKEDTDNNQWVDLVSPDGRDSVGVVFKKAGNYNLIIQFEDDNASMGPLFFSLVDDDLTPEGNKEASASAPLTIAPNPTTGEFVISLGGENNIQISIVNMLGQTVYSIETSDATVSVNTTLAAGVYTVIATSESGVKTAKLMVK